MPQSGIYLYGVCNKKQKVKFMPPVITLVKHERTVITIIMRCVCVCARASAKLNLFGFLNCYLMAAGSD